MWPPRSGSGAARTWLRWCSMASRSAASGAASGAQAVCSSGAPVSRAKLAISSSIRVLPEPGPPVTRTAPPWPDRARAHASRSRRHGSSRPTNGTTANRFGAGSVTAAGSPSSERRSAASAAPFWYRSSGSLASSRATIAPSWAGASGRAVDSGGAGVVACIRSNSPVSSVTNGGAPVRHWKSTAPSAYRSARPSTGRLSIFVCSGAEYSSVPATASPPS